MPTENVQPESVAAQALGWIIADHLGDGPLEMQGLRHQVFDETGIFQDLTIFRGLFRALHIGNVIRPATLVLIGRGIYALKEWGYKKGTVADIISEVLREAGEPLHRDEIVKRVLKSRFVKETTILLNLQGKSQFKRVAKATYELAE